MGLPFSVIVSDVKENASKDLPPDRYVMELALQKARAVAAEHPDACVIGCDTIVYLDGEILGKPHTPENAKRFLSRMQGRDHLVYTGVAVITNGRADVDVAETEVTFSPMTEEEIDWYVSTGEPLDKAGAYGVQGSACLFVEKVSGNYFNVVGLPVPLLYRMLKNAGVVDCGNNIHS